MSKGSVTDADFVSLVFLEMKSTQSLAFRTSTSSMKPARQWFTVHPSYGRTSSNHEVELLRDYIDKFL